MGMGEIIEWRVNPWVNTLDERNGHLKKQTQKFKTKKKNEKEGRKKENK